MTASTTRGGRDERGLSLAEAVVAIGIFGLALLGLNTMLISTIRTSELAKDLATARFLAEHRLEQIKNARYLDGNRDAWRDPTDPCTDIDEVTAANFPDEDYGEVDLNNGTRFNFESCAATPDIKSSAVMFTRASYPSTTQGDHDYWVNHGQYAKFRREVYIVDSLDYSNAIDNVYLDGLDPDAKDTVVVDESTPTASNPATNYVKYVIVRVKWRDSHGHPHHVTYSTEKAYYIPSF